MSFASVTVHIASVLAHYKLWVSTQMGRRTRGSGFDAMQLGIYLFRTLSQANFVQCGQHPLTVRA